MKKYRYYIVLLLIVCLIFILQWLVVIGVIPFLFNGLDYITENEERYNIYSKAINIDETIVFSENQSVMIDGITVTVSKIEKKEETFYFTMLIQNLISFNSGKMLSQKNHFKSAINMDEQKRGQVLLELYGDFHKCDRKAVSYGKNTIEYIYSVELSDIDLADKAQIHLLDFHFTEYQRL